jgi:DNA-binding Lrp family transcriptional regulator
MVYDYLRKNYAEGEPIFLTDIEIDGMTEENIRYHLKKLTDDGVIARFAAGIYYMPKTDIFGDKMSLSSETVALHKYIFRRGKPVGFYSGYTLSNKLGLSLQVPFKTEITSNYAPAQVREISIKDRKYILRRPVIEITDDNRYAMQLLECLKDLDKTAESDAKFCGSVLTGFAKKHGITREKIDALLVYYPLKIYKSIYETELEYVSA